MATTTADRYHRYQHYFIGAKALYKKKKTRVYTSIILSILTVAFFGFFAIRPTLVTISGLLKEIKDKKAVVEQMDQKINNLTKAQINYSRIANELNLVGESLPQDPALPILIKQLESLARLSSVNLESIRYEKTNLQGELAKEESQATSFNIALTGSYQNLKQFLNSLDTLRRIISVESFAFNSKIEEEIQIMALTINAQAYYLIKN